MNLKRQNSPFALRWGKLTLSLFLILPFIILLYNPPQCLSQTITKGPYLIEPGQTEMIIRWESDSKIYSTVEYGLDSICNNKKEAVLRDVKDGGFLYEVKLEKLKPGSHYFYQVNSGTTKSSLNYFKTFSFKQPNIHFVAMGDSRSHPDIFTEIINKLETDEPDFIISMGDLVEYGGNLSEWNDYYFDITNNLADHIPLVSTLGDHEGDDDNGEMFRHYLRANEPTEKLWFSFDYGDAHFTSLDYRYPESKEMIDWFIKDMSASKAKWKFVFFHRPSYNLGGHRSSWGREIWPALFSKNKVDIVFAGHSHLYERFYPLIDNRQSDKWPVTYITTGGAGADLYEMTHHSSLAAAESVNHFVDVFISGDTLKLQTFRADGSLLDRLTFTKNGDNYNTEYLGLAQSQERVNLLTNFISGISLRLEYIPVEDFPAPCRINLKSSVDQDIPIYIELTDDSAKYYKMTPFKGILKPNEEKKVDLKLKSNTETINISMWGEIKPELKLKLIYTYDSIQDTLIGGRAEYYPGID